MVRQPGLHTVPPADLTILNSISVSFFSLHHNTWQPANRPAGVILA